MRRGVETSQSNERLTDEFNNTEDNLLQYDKNIKNAEILLVYLTE